MNLYLAEIPDVTAASPGDPIAVLIAAPNEPRAREELDDYVSQESLSHTNFTLDRLGTGRGPVRIVIDSRRTLAQPQDMH